MSYESYISGRSENDRKKEKNLKKIIDKRYPSEDHVGTFSC